MMEATIALALLFLGLMGMGAMAMATLRANVDAQDRTQANNLADRVLEMIRTEAYGWNRGEWSPAAETPNQTRFFPLLSKLPGEVRGSSQFAEFSRELDPGGAGVRAFNSSLDPVAPGAIDAKYCVHYNMTWLNPNESARADVRVYWLLRDTPGGMYDFNANCGQNNITKMAADIENVRCVARTGYIMRNSQGGVR